MSFNKGSELERRIADFFKLNGYEARQNVFMEGRSGGRHEIDVLAEKSDGITTFTIAVECKAWNHPIEKSVVSKLSYIMGDLGINKGIVVSLMGTRVGADQAAAQLGIDIWGQEEVAAKLGQVAVSELNVGPPSKEALMLGIRTSAETAMSMINNQRRGAFGIGSEQVTWSNFVWLPFHCLTLSLSSPEKSFLRKSIKTQQRRNLYEAVSGHYASTIATGGFDTGALGEFVVQPRVKDSIIIREIQKTTAKLNEVVTKSAVDRYAAKLQAMGVPVEVHSVGVDSSLLVFVPHYVAIVNKKGKNRAIAINAAWSNYSKPVSDALTANLTYFQSSIGQ